MSFTLAGNDTALRSYTRIDDGEVDRPSGKMPPGPAQQVLTCTNIAGRNLVADVYEREIRPARQQHALHLRYVAIGGAEVGEQGDDRHRSDLHGTPPSALPEEHHGDAAGNRGHTQREPDAEQPEHARPPRGERDLHRGEARAHDLRPERIARPGQGTFQYQLEALADLRKRDHAQVQYAVCNYARITGEQRDQPRWDEEKRDCGRHGDDQAIAHGQPNGFLCPGLLVGPEV